MKKKERGRKRVTELFFGFCIIFEVVAPSGAWVSMEDEHKFKKISFLCTNRTKVGPYRFQGSLLHKKIIIIKSMRMDRPKMICISKWIVFVKIKE